LSVSGSEAIRDPSSRAGGFLLRGLQKWHPLHPARRRCSVGIERKLAAWKKAGLLTEDQAAAIALHEQSQASGARWVVWSIASVGGLAIAVGIISVIAANWDDIPEKVKLAACGALLLGSLGGAWRTSRLENLWPRDLFLLFHSGMVPATIGLIAQIYHLSGHPWRAVALCAAFALPAAVVAKQGLLTDVFIGFLTLALGLFMSEYDWFNNLFDGDLRVAFIYAAFGLMLLFSASAIRGAHLGASAAAKRWGIGLLAATSVAASVCWDTTGSRWLAQQPHSILQWPQGIFLAAAAAFSARLWWTRPPALGARLAAIALLTLLLCGALVGRVDQNNLLLRQFIGFGLFAGLCIAVAMAAAESGSRLGTNLATLALAARVFVFYLELAKNLMTTGIGLIVTGFVCLAVAYAWWRLRRTLPVAARSGGAT